MRRLRNVLTTLLTALLLVVVIELTGIDVAELAYRLGDGLERTVTTQLMEVWAQR